MQQRNTVAHCQDESEEEAVAEDEAAFEDKNVAVMDVPKELVPGIREMITM